MTTAIEIRIGHLQPGKRVVVENGSAILATLIATDAAHVTHIWDGREVTLREIDAPAPVKPEPEAVTLWDQQKGERRPVTEDDVDRLMDAAGENAQIRMALVQLLQQALKVAP